MNLRDETEKKCVLKGFIPNFANRRMHELSLKNEIVASIFYDELCVSTGSEVATRETIGNVI